MHYCRWKCRNIAKKKTIQKLNKTTFIYNTTFARVFLKNTQNEVNLFKFIETYNFEAKNFEI
jgi:hypothetical protein